MRFRKLGRSNIEVSEISFGCWTMGGPNWRDGRPIGWADVDEDAIVRAIKAGLDAGVNHFDNADIYGNGRAERMLARALAKLGVKSESIVIATKMGHFQGCSEHAYLPFHIRRQCEQSLINLKRDHIDLYYFHHGDFGPDACYLPDAAATLDALVQEGKVRLKGQSAYSAADFARAVPVVKPAVLQSWANALEDDFVRPGSPISQLMAEHGATFVAFSPLGQGLLLDKFDPDHPPSFEEGDHRSASDKFTPDKLRALKPRLARLKERFGSSTEDLAGVAMHYILAQPHVSCVIPGFRNERQALCNVAQRGRHLSPDDLAFIRATLRGD